MKKRKGSEAGSRWRREMPDLAAVLVTAMAILGVASIGGSSTPTAVEKSPAAASLTAGVVATHYADAQRDVLDLQLD